MSSDPFSGCNGLTDQSPKVGSHLIVQPRRFNPWKTLGVLAVLLAAYVGTQYRGARVVQHPAWTGQTMGTTYSIRLANTRLSNDQLAELKRKVEQRLEEINLRMSHYRPDSELSQFNAIEAGQPFRISSDFARVLKFALEVHAASGGAFDPALGALIDAWGFGPAGRETEIPDALKLENLRSAAGAKYIRFLDDHTIVKDGDGVLLNLSAVAKGFGADEVARVIRQFGVSNVFVEIGGEVVAFGKNPSGKPWRVGVESPNPESLPGESFELVLALTNEAVATSGDYRNFRTDAAGRRLTHILDPRTGRPVEHHLASVSVVAMDGMTADALATAAFVLGPEDGLAFLAAWSNVEALLLVRMPDGRFEHRTTPGFDRYIARSPH